MLLKPRSGKGRFAVHEIMIVNAAIRNLIRENKLFQIPGMMQSGKGEGMQTMEAALKDLVARNTITREMAIAAINNPKLFEADYKLAAMNLGKGSR